MAVVTAGKTITASLSICAKEPYVMEAKRYSGDTARLDHDLEHRALVG